MFYNQISERYQVFLNGSIIFVTDLPTFVGLENTILLCKRALLTKKDFYVPKRSNCGHNIFFVSKNVLSYLYFDIKFPEGTVSMDIPYHANEPGVCDDAKHIFSGYRLEEIDFLFQDVEFLIDCGLYRYDISIHVYLHLPNSLDDITVTYLNV